MNEIQRLLLTGSMFLGAVALWVGADPGTLPAGSQNRVQAAADCVELNLRGTASHAEAKEMADELRFQYANKKASSKTAVSFCVDARTGGAAMGSFILFGGAWTDNPELDRKKCKRISATVNFMPAAVDILINRDGTDRKWQDGTMLRHEYHHARQTYPIRAYLEKLGIDTGSDSTDPANSKGSDAFHIAQVAVTLEHQKKEFDATFNTELCEVIERCGIKRGTVVDAKKAKMQAKLKQICAKLAAICAAFDQAYDGAPKPNEVPPKPAGVATQNNAYNTNHNGPGCRQAAVNFTNSAGDPKTATIDLDTIMSEVKAHKDDKDKKTKVQQGETKTEVQKKKDAALTAVGCPPA